MFNFEKILGTKAGTYENLKSISLVSICFIKDIKRILAEGQLDSSFERFATIKNITEPYRKLDMFFYPTKLGCNATYPIHLPF